MTIEESEPINVVCSFQSVNGEVIAVDPTSLYLRDMQEFAMSNGKAILWVRDSNMTITHAVVMNQKAWEYLQSSFRAI